LILFSTSTKVQTCLGQIVLLFKQLHLFCSTLWCHVTQSTFWQIDFWANYHSYTEFNWLPGRLVVLQKYTRTEQEFLMEDLKWYSSSLQPIVICTKSFEQQKVSYFCDRWDKYKLDWILL